MRRLGILLEPKYVRYVILYLILVATNLILSSFYIVHPIVNPASEFVYLENLQVNILIHNSLLEANLNA